MDYRVSSLAVIIRGQGTSAALNREEVSVYQESRFHCLCREAFPTSSAREGFPLGPRIIICVDMLALKFAEAKCSANFVIFSK